MEDLTMYYHVSEWYKPERDGPLRPQTPSHCDSSGDEETGRISAAPTVGQCLAGMFAPWDMWYLVYAIHEVPDVIITTDIEDDADDTGEVWYTHPVTPELVGRVHTVADYEWGYGARGMCVTQAKPRKDVPYDEGFEWVSDAEWDADLERLKATIRGA